MKKAPSRLEAITLLLPDGTLEEKQFFTLLLSLFLRLPGASIGLGSISLRPSFPEGALPNTRFEMAGVAYPRIQFETSQPIHLEAGRLVLSSGSSRVSSATLPEADAAGVFGADSKPLPIAELLFHLHGRFVRVDHTGVIVPGAIVSRADWEELLRDLAACANLYRYPDGADWPFIIPASNTEFSGEISEFAAGREPKFELVYEPSVGQAIFQIDLQTSLTRGEMEVAFPPGTGFTLPGLGEYFRSVLIANPWPGFFIRVDMRYKGDAAPSTWDTGEWLVTEGGRIAGA